MKYKRIFALLAIFILAASVAAVFAEDAHLGSVTFEVPNGYKISEQNDTAIVLANGNKQIIVSTDIIGQSAIESYLSGQGYQYNTTLSGNTTITGGSQNGTFEFNCHQFAKDKGLAVGCMVNKDGQEISVIGIDNDYQKTGSFFSSSQIARDSESILTDIMLGK